MLSHEVSQEKSAVLETQLQSAQASGKEERSHQPGRPNATHNDAVDTTEMIQVVRKGPWPLKSPRDCAKPFTLAWL